LALPFAPFVESSSLVSRDRVSYLPTRGAAAAPGPPAFGGSTWPDTKGRTIR
jgi:hypothetical protein